MKNILTTYDKAINYMVEATLATIEYMSTLKNISKHEFTRQCNIAQKGLDFIKEHGEVIEDRVKDIIESKQSVFVYYSIMRKKYFGNKG